MDREVIVSLIALTNTMKYLGERPYKEVVDLIDGLRQTIREVPKNEQTDQEDPEQSPATNPERTGIAK